MGILFDLAQAAREASASAAKRRDLSALATRSLSAAKARRGSQSRDKQLSAALRALGWRSLESAHADLLGGSDAAAARFFLDQVYPRELPAWRDSQAVSAIASMCALLPMPALESLACALELDAMAEELEDLCAIEAKAMFPGERSAGQWELALGDAPWHMACGMEGRRRQAWLCAKACRSLAEASKAKLARPALAAMAAPAKACGLGELQLFLHDGLSAFESISDPESFAKSILDAQLWLLPKQLSEFEAFKTQARRAESASSASTPGSCAEEPMGSNGAGQG